MAHHKRKRPKHQRAGCLFCKPWKASGHSHKKKTRHTILRQEKRHTDE